MRRTTFVALSLVVHKGSGRSGSTSGQLAKELGGGPVMCWALVLASPVTEGALDGITRRCVMGLATDA